MNQAVGGYDSEANPRSLRAVSDEAKAEFEEQVERLKEEVNVCNKQAGMFNSQGWKSLRVGLENQIQYAVNALASDELNTMTAVCYIRGQIRAFQYLLAQEQTVVLRRQAAQEELRQLRSEATDSDGLPSVDHE